jgi:hypothetical protein
MRSEGSINYFTLFYYNFDQKLEIFFVRVGLGLATFLAYTLVLTSLVNFHIHMC